MKLTLNNKQVTFYDTIDELPIKRYNLLNKYSLIDLGIGSDVSDIVRHHSRFNQFLELKDYESLYVENENLMINYNFILSSKNIKGYVLASLIKEIDGEKVDVSDSTIEEYVDFLEQSSLTIGQLADYTDNLKKNFLRL
jgi:hypothetical protein